MDLFVELLIIEDELDRIKGNKKNSNDGCLIELVLFVIGIVVYFKLRAYAINNFYNYTPYFIVMIIICTISIPVIWRSNKKIDKILAKIIRIVNLLCSTSLIWIIYSHFEDPILTSTFVNYIDKVDMGSIYSIKFIIFKMITSIIGLILYISEIFIIQISAIPYIQSLLYRMVGIKLDKKNLITG